MQGSLISRRDVQVDSDSLCRSLTCDILCDMHCFGCGALYRFKGSADILPVVSIASSPLTERR